MRLRLICVLAIFTLIAVSCEIRDRNDNLPLNSPHFFIDEIKNGRVASLIGEKAELALNRWQIAIDGATNAQRPVPILDTIVGAITALIVVDMQNVFLAPGAAIEVPAGRAIIPNINRLANEIRGKNGIVIWLRYMVNDDVGLLRYFEKQSYLGGNRISPLDAMKPGHPQFELHSDLNVDESDIVMNKTRYSAVLGSHIVDTLEAYNIENAIITGVTTDVCAGNTAECLMQMDFHVVMVWDGCAALDRLEHELYLARIFGLYGDVMPTQEVIDRLQTSNNSAEKAD